MSLNQLDRSFLLLRKEYIKKQFRELGLNDRQLEAVTSTEGPLLVLAGAGSGKTTVLVSRVQCILEFGSAFESEELPRAATEADLTALDAAIDGAPLPDSLLPMLHHGNTKPWNILCITFTNKAAGELKTRISKRAGEAGAEVLASTFHSACVRFLRRDAELLGYPKSFTIYDTDDSKRVMKELYKALGIDDKLLDPKSVLSKIGRFKDQMLSPREAMEQAKDPRSQTIARLYAEYQKRLKSAGAMDFDDLIYNTVVLLRDHPEIREYYAGRFHYVMVDEYQDTSHAQYLLTELLSSGRGNLFVVGDDDQSIYRFRGATIDNILSFESCFRGAKVIRLEQNYRSTSPILDAANSVISNNIGRKGKTLWTAKSGGEPIVVYVAQSERDEADYVAREIERYHDSGHAYSDCAILYRMNALSNAVETQLRRFGIPYRVVGGTRFYDRAEIKDVVAYMEVTANPEDNLRLKRIINTPPRKIGAATVSEIERIADGIGTSMMEVIKNADSYPTLSRASKALADFSAICSDLSRSAEEDTLFAFTQTVLERTGYRSWLERQGDDGAVRLQNAEELLTNVRHYEDESDEADLYGFLEEVALVSDIDEYDPDADSAVLMTLHSAKGLEFSKVFIVGMEEGIFPGEQSRYNAEDLEEERRLAYVGITRARKQLTLSRAAVRMMFGSTRRNPGSRFLDEIPESLKDDRTPNYGGSLKTRGYEEVMRSTVSLGSRSSFHEGFGAPATKPTGQEKIPKPAFQSGERVSHKKFGEGTVLSAVPMGNDLLVEVDFDECGKKKMMANFAPLERI